MAFENLIVDKCCGIVPIRPCLVVFSVLKIVADLIVAAITGYILLILLAFYQTTEVSILVPQIISMVDITFMIILIIGASQKNIRLLKISFYYGIISLVVVVITTIVCMMLTYMPEYNLFDRQFYSCKLSEMENMLIHISVITTYTLVHMYVILVMESEITKTSSNGSIYRKMDTSREFGQTV